MTHDDARVERIRERLEALLGDTHDDIRYFTAGGMSWLYRARHRTTHTERVIKVLRPVSGDTESDRQRFLGEARVVAGLHHAADGVVAQGVALVDWIDILESRAARRRRRPALIHGVVDFQA